VPQPTAPLRAPIRFKVDELTLQELEITSLFNMYLAINKGTTFLNI
jgi:hypothetical protein